MRPIWTLLLSAVLGATPTVAQQVVSTRAGTIHHIEGKAFLNDQLLDLQPGKFPMMDQGAILRTELGRAELLLTPGSIARLGEFTAVKLLSSDLQDTRLELLAGALTLEVVELLEHNSVTLQWRENRIAIERPGFYELTGEPPEFRVYKGQAQLLANDQELKVKSGRRVHLGATQLAVAKLDDPNGDPLYRWSARRSRYLAMANLSAAKSLYDSGLAWAEPGWFWNPWFGLWTFIPARGVYSSPFGYSFWSPHQVVHVYTPPRPEPAWQWAGGSSGYYSAERGYVVVTGRSAASSTATVPAAAPTASAPAESPRSAGTGSPRVGGGRGQ